MEHSSSTCALLTTDVEEGHKKWLGRLSVKKKALRSLSASPDQRTWTNRSGIDRGSFTDRTPIGMDIPSVVSVPDDFPYFTMTIKPRSAVFLVYANDTIRQIVLTTLANQWGLDPRKRHKVGLCEDGAYWVKLRNQPFLDGTGTANRVKLAKAICECINKIRQIGWELSISIDLANQYPASTLFFVRKPRDFFSAPIQTLGKLACLSVDGSDTLTLTDAPEILVDCFKRTICESYEPGLAKKCPTNNGKSCENGSLIEKGGTGSTFISFRLKGQPFFSHDKMECIRGRQLILDLVTDFDARGYQPYGTLNLTCSSDNILFSRKSTDVRSRYMCISLMLTNKIRLIDAPANVQEAIKKLASHGPWEHGMESIKVESQRVTKIKFHGHPWNPLATECHWARRFLCHLFMHMANLGWRCVISFDLNRNLYNKATFLFSKSADQENHVISPSYHVFCLNLSSGCYCQLVDAPVVVRQKFSEIAHRAWPKSVAGEPMEIEGVQDWTLHMSPWSWGKLYDAHGRSLMTLFIDECEKLGYRVLTAANILTKYDMPNDLFPKDAHCIFFESI